MRKRCSVYLLLSLAAAGCARQAYDTYTNRDEVLKFSWQVPHGWRARAYHHPDYEAAGVTFFPARQEKEPYHAFFAVWAAQLPHQLRGGAETLRDAARRSLTKAMRLPNARLLDRGGRMIDTETAAEAVIAYTGSTDISRPDAPAAPVKERFLILLCDDRVVTIRYVNREADFDHYEAAFLHGLETLRFH
ncbi:MAG: hypothetical protein ACM3L6_01810 [Deltaproteobacteria bacterium]